MAVVQISRIQHRRGKSDDLPQLASAELGWSINNLLTTATIGEDFSDPDSKSNLPNPAFLHASSTMSPK